MCARPMPVLPAVPSTTVPPGFNAPRFSASRTIQSAARSFTEPPGLRNSALPRISQPVSSESLFSRMRGVLPTEPANPSNVRMRALYLLEGPAVHRVEAGEVTRAREDLELVRDAHGELERALRVGEALLEVEQQPIVEPLADAHDFR